MQKFAGGEEGEDWGKRGGGEEEGEETRRRRGEGEKWDE